MKRAFEAGMLLSHYRLERRLETEGQTQLWFAKDVREKKTALLEIPIGLEAKWLYYKKQVAERLGSAITPSVLRLEAKYGPPFLVFFCLDAITLRDFLNDASLWENEKLRWDVAVKFVDVVRRLHAKGGVHGHLRPEKVLVVWKKNRKVISHCLLLDVLYPGEEERRRKREREKEVLREASLYAAPELAEAKQGVDQLTDIYGVGVILFEIFSGYPPHYFELWKRKEEKGAELFGGEFPSDEEDFFKEDLEGDLLEEELLEEDLGREDPFEEEVLEEEVKELVLCATASSDRRCPSIQKLYRDLRSAGGYFVFNFSFLLTFPCLVFLLLLGIGGQVVAAYFSGLWLVRNLGEERYIRALGTFALSLGYFGGVLPRMVKSYWAKFWKNSIQFACFFLLLPGLYFFLLIAVNALFRPPHPQKSLAELRQFWQSYQQGFQKQDISFVPTGEGERRFFQNLHQLIWHSLKKQQVELKLLPLSQSRVKKIPLSFEGEAKVLGEWAFVKYKALGEDVADWYGIALLQVKGKKEVLWQLVLVVGYDFFEGRWYLVEIHPFQSKGESK